MSRTHRNFATLSTISLVVFFGGCSSVPTTQFDAKWEFLSTPSGEKRACLALDDVKELREILIRARATEEACQ